MLLQVPYCGERYHCCPFCLRSLLFWPQGPGLMARFHMPLLSPQHCPGRPCEACYLALGRGDWGRPSSLPFGGAQMTPMPRLYPVGPPVAAEREQSRENPQALVLGSDGHDPPAFGKRPQNRPRARVLHSEQHSCPRPGESPRSLTAQGKSGTVFGGGIRDGQATGYYCSHKLHTNKYSLEMNT